MLLLVFLFCFFWKPRRRVQGLRKIPVVVIDRVSQVCTFPIYLVTRCTGWESRVVVLHHPQYGLNVYLIDPYFYSL